MTARASVAPVPRSPGVPRRRAAWPLVVLTDRRQARGAGHGLEAVVAAVCEAGAPAVLLREKDLPAPERRALAGRLARVTAISGADLIVAGDAGLAVEIGAPAVHLSSSAPWRLPPAAAANGAGGLVVGRSCHSVGELREAARHGAAYATLSPVFATASKPGYGPALGTEGLAAACAAVPDLPVLALGGLRPGRAAACPGAGAAGVAVMGEVMRADDPGAVVRRLLGELGAA